MTLEVVNLKKSPTSDWTPLQASAGTGIRVRRHFYQHQLTPSTYTTRLRESSDDNEGVS